ncbi:DUF3618 domain-containing protein [Kineococcus aurantiacus]|uniref:DUF3618 domain-containing protein n=1 Tax=Kineococcus aurantiacus TaxID=37633 RepID=A0A7Y9J140_9ACTN|nr:DUF3618 domain-containing protein [Kineococcus aurantiacus]NYD22806.1 hypothetical protein [Kineococcus aurantiacus]
MSDSVPTDRDELEKDIAATRERLASTADALAAKADVKAQAQAKAEDLKQTAQQKVHDVSDSAPGTPKQQTGVLVGAIVVATALAIWLVVRKR